MKSTYNGLINIYKEPGFTSNDVVAKLRGILKQKKIGHTGTLDPDAVGVLVVCLGTGTKLVEMLTDHDKEYIAVCRLGVTTDTQDMSGNIIETSDAKVTKEQVHEAVKAFIGD
jgi:tRNA pseudouridine55 synthase